MIDRERFDDLWLACADIYDFWELAQDIKPSLTWREFDKGWQWATVLNHDLDIAWSEFQRVLSGIDTYGLHK